MRVTPTATIWLFCSNTTLAWMTGMPNELVTVPRTIAARVVRAAERIRKRQKLNGRRYLRRDRTGMKILFLPEPRISYRAALPTLACAVPARRDRMYFPDPAKPTGNRERGE